MSHIPNYLAEGERIIRESRMHWAVVVWMIVGITPVLQIFISLLSISQSMFSTSDMSSVSCFGVFNLLGFVFTVVFAVLLRNSVEYALTNRRVIKKTGLVGRNFQEFTLNKIESIQINETLIGRMVGYKDLIITGTGGTHIVFGKLTDAEEFRRLITNVLARRSNLERRQRPVASPYEDDDAATDILVTQFERARYLYSNGKVTEAITILEVLSAQGYERAAITLAKIRAKP